MYGVHRTCAETAAVSGGTIHPSVVSTPLRWIFKTALQKLVTLVESHASAASLLESVEKRYIKAFNNTYLKHVPYEAVSDDGDGALEQGVAVEVVVGLEVGTQQSETHQRVDVNDDETQHGHPQQRHS